MSTRPAAHAIPDPGTGSEPGCRIDGNTAVEAFRRVAIMIKVPTDGSRELAIEMVSIGSVDLVGAQRIDASASDG